MIRNWLEKLLIRKTLGRHISSPIIEDMLSSHWKPQKLEPATIHFAFVMVRGSTPDQISERMGIISELAEGHGGITDALLSGIVAIIWHPSAANLESARKRFTRQLAELFPTDSKLLHGSSPGHLGNLGGPKIMSFSFILSDTEKIIGTWNALPFGTFEEWRPS